MRRAFIRLNHYAGTDVHKDIRRCNRIPGTDKIEIIKAKYHLRIAKTTDLCKYLVIYFVLGAKLYPLNVLSTSAVHARLYPVNDVESFQNFSKPLPQNYFKLCNLNV